MYFRDRMRDSWFFTFFIARTLQKRQKSAIQTSSGNKKVSQPITRIATISIALAMIVNCVTIAVVDGFQHEVSRKVIGFGSHISIQKQGEGSIMESSPLLFDSKFASTLQGVKGVSSIQSVAYKPALLQSSSKIEQKEILGVVLKGVDNSYDWSFFSEYIVAGTLPRFTLENSTDMLISKRIARDLHYSVGDTVNAYFVKQQPIQWQFKVVGIYETGLEDFDKELVFCHLNQVQQLNDWGITAQITIDDTLSNGELIVRADVNGGNGNYRYDWGKGYERYSGFSICPKKDTVIRLIASDYWSNMNEPSGKSLSEGETSIADTAYLEIKISGNKGAECFFNRTTDGSLIRTYLDQDGYHYRLNAGEKQLDIESFPGHGSFQNYVGAYEIMLGDFEQLEEIKKNISKLVVLNPDLEQQVQVNSIKDQQMDLFTWLSFLDINMVIVLILMLVIGIINMGSALLVMILVRTNFIGILKSLGASNWTIRKIFLVHMSGFIFRGMVWGNVIGIGFCLLQEYFSILPLDPKIYYLNSVPILINVWMILLLNAITILVCFSALIIPSVLISRISPAQSIRFR